MTKRKRYTAVFKAKVALEAIRQDRSARRGARFIGRCLQSHPRNWRQKAVKHDHPDMSVRHQCVLLSLSRSAVYYQPRGGSAENLRFMQIIDKQFLETPWYESRQMARYMQREGRKYGRHRVRRLMTPMRLVPIDQELRPANSIPHSSHGLLTPAEAYDTQNSNQKAAA